MDVLTELAREPMADELRELGVRDEDLATLLDWRDALRQRPDDLARLEVLVERLHALVGHRELIGSVFEDSDDQHELGRGAVAFWALVLAAPRLRQVQAERGIRAEVTRASLADLGQQVWKDRQVNGSTGLHNHHWLCHVWADGYLRLGRLQFELTTSDLGVLPEPVAVLSVHIDESGPLDPAAVDDSLRPASTFFEEHYPEAGPVDWIICGSWLLDPNLAWRMPDSNLADFSRRWTVWQVTPNDRDACYFGFGVEPPGGRDPGLSPAELLGLGLQPRTSLQRAVLDIWREGESLMLCHGRLPVIADHDGL